MWRNLLASTATTTHPKSVVQIFDAPDHFEGRPKGTPAFSQGSSFNTYWLCQPLSGSVNADLSVLCIDYLTRDWPLHWFAAIEGPKVLHLYNCQQQAWDPNAEFVQQYLRLYCLEFDIALAFDPDWSLLILGELGKGPKHPHDVVTRIVVPSGWDSKQKIAVTNESFPVDKDWRSIRLPELNEVDLPTQRPEEPLDIGDVVKLVKNRGQKETARLDTRQELGNVLEGLLQKANS